MSQPLLSLHQVKKSLNYIGLISFIFYLSGYLAWADDDVIKQEIAHHFVIGFSGEYLTDCMKTYLEQYPPGGVILFDRNIKNLQQLQAFIHSIRQTTSHQLILMIDQEGGNVARLRPETGFNLTYPSALQLGDEPASKAYSVGYQIGQLLKSLDIDMNLAPVVDLAVDHAYLLKKNRTFSKDPLQAAQQAMAFTQGLHAAGILNCLKHFPGHGSTEVDPHLTWTDVSAVYQKQEILPFQILIEAHLADSIMIGHLYHRDWDSHYPASLSYLVMQHQLREQLGFKGLILTDDLSMGAIHLSATMASKQALMAGADLILLLPHSQALSADDHLVCAFYNTTLQELWEVALDDPFFLSKLHPSEDVNNIHLH